MADRATATIKVKPLVWKRQLRDNAEYLSASTSIGRYDAFEEPCFGKTHRWRCPGVSGGTADSLEAAKDAAQADYETRILSAIVTQEGREDG